MDKINEIYAYFRLSGVDLDPDEITAKVGIEPTETWKTGDLIIRPKGRRVTRKFSLWKVKSKLDPLGELDPTEVLDLHVESVFEQLEPGWESLVKICRDYDALICGVVYVYTDMPAICLTKENIKKISELNAGIDIDVYARIKE
ncbi:MAG TPA: hypothetical protein DEG17_17565 [Cyanobacteria bacterium UBA11149]|nr:hypothetical protein [Cyanobacteria bacterium UBA11367]HBE58597.1 hypothetical protein [Cyanobacteria bacterium UBA11366]HBK65796.1 hypothetical protein [Cyanobacteria bacterium UBA11166]HBR74014.1 hypothetical protein [Cyanobacteria bacterium UBA11159]HBS67838.1 hypothetical protein [Cyanobacteria bacterium UBA11153]HBW90630.1 hypothetical protein [Cyanobacteria bacterium UBA11149]HCA93689.1 hypothetical protein [Cyanobacteria bacterium UBA9226]